MAINYDKARTCVELCRFSYKMYAQTVKFPFDPFFEANQKHTNTKLNITRNRMMAHIHDVLGTPSNDDRRKFDPIQYRLDVPPNPGQSVVYRGDINNSYLVFVPGTWDKKIGEYAGFDLEGNKLLPLPTSLSSGNCKCGYFQGQTGMTATHPNSGWTSFLGAVIYDPTTKTAYIVFRGSRSGNGARAATGAQFRSKGSPDWVTDMNHLKEAEPFNPNFDFGDLNGRNKVKLATGFWKAYVSSNKSMEAAFKYAVSGCEVNTVCVTGHSLGGGLAQCAYIHLCCSPRIKSRLNLKATAVVECYPIAAPPVCLGVETQHWISRNANASNVHHYYCPYDAVHACHLVLSGMESKASTVLGLRHPLTSPYHFGSQLALNSNATFPAAHEPSTIWKALWDDKSVPKEFWQQIDFDIVNSQVNSSSSTDPIDKSTILDAINQSFNAADFKERAEQWAVGITGHGVMNRGNNKNTALGSIFDVNKEYFSDFKKENVAQRKTVVDSINKNIHNNSSDTAGCVYHTLLIGIGIQRLLRDFQGVPLKVLLQNNIPKVDFFTRSRSNTI